MPPLQVRDLPQEIYEPFKQMTELEHRSLAQQTIVALEYYLANHEIQDGKVIEKGQGRVGLFTPFERDGVVFMTDPNAGSAAHRARLQALFDEISELPTPEDPDGSSTVAELIREERDSRAERVLQAVEEGPWR